MKTKNILFLSVLFFCSVSHADPVSPYVRKQIKLEDGRAINAKVVGDEYGYYFYDEATNAYFEKDINGDTFIPITYDEIYRRMETVSKARNVKGSYSMDVDPYGAVGYTGKKKCLLILVEFNDVRFSDEHDLSYYNKIFNERNLQYGRFGGSVKDYFLEQSNGQFELEFDIVGPVKMENDYYYYGKNEDGKLDPHLGELVVFACNKRDDNIDFSEYDWDKDGVVEQIGIIYSGVASSSTNNDDDIWPQKSELSYYDKSFSADGVDINTFFCSSEFRTEGQESGIGTICHEFSHCMGLPDTYNMVDKNNGTQRWDLMGDGVHNDDGFVPSGFTAFEKIYCGWLKPIELINSIDISGMKALSVGGECYKITNKAYPQEFFLIENRQKIGFDKGLPGKGMLIYHIDYNPYFFSVNSVNTLSNGNTEYRCRIVAANGEEDKNQQGCCFPTDDNNIFSNNSVPASYLYHPNIDGSKYLSKPITNITLDGGLISFSFMNELNDQDYKLFFDYHIDEAGTLSTMIPEGEMYGIETMKITGNLNGSDILTLRKMSGKDEKGMKTGGILKDIDMSDVRFVTSGDIYYLDKVITNVNEMPCFAFVSTGLHSIVLPKSIVSIGQECLSRCKMLESVEMGDNIKTIGAYAFFEDIALKNITLGRNIKEIYSGAFKDCTNLTEVTLNDNLEHINDHVFSDCINLRNIVIPKSVSLIMSNAFENCNHLETIVSEIVTPFDIPEDVFSRECYINTILYVPFGKLEYYKTKTGWKNFVNIQEMGPETTIKGDANGDGVVNTADIVTVVNYIMGNTSMDFVYENADINDDHVLNAADIVLIVNKIMTIQETNNK